MNVIADTISQITIGAPRAFGKLCLFPLLSDLPPAFPYKTLDDALHNGKARVTEISEGGSVPDLRFDNDGNEPVFLLDGEELVGARQNRIINISILVGAHQSIIIPVSCVEHGRWAYTSRHFRSADRTLFAKARAAKMRDVTQSLHASQERRANQHAVWHAISEKAARMAVDSPTDAMSDIFESRTSHLGDYRAALCPQQGQVGAAFAIGGTLIGVELFDAAESYAKLHSKLISGYAVDAIEERVQSSSQITLEGVRQFLARIAETPATPYRALGDGTDLRISSQNLSGGALEVEGRIIHLAAFLDSH